MRFVLNPKGQTITERLGDEGRIFQLQNCALRFLKTHAHQSISVKKKGGGEIIVEEGKEESMEETLYAFKFELNSGINNEPLMEF